MSADESDQKSPATVWLTSVLIAFVIYLLSPGPVIMLLDRYNVSLRSPLGEVAVFWLTPISWAVRYVPGAKQCYTPYLKLFGLEMTYFG